MELLGGRILFFDLSKNKVHYEDFVNYAKFLGGRGVNQYLLFKYLPVGLSPFHPRNLVTIGAGLLVGTEAPGACRVSIDTKNVFTGGVGSANVGGSLGPALRSAGITNLAISGRAKRLVYLLIENGRVEIKDASHLRHKTTSEVERIVKRDLGLDFSVTSVGPAGENLVGAASVIVDGARSASRCGVGAIFGSKKLKAIAVKGDTQIEVEDEQRFSSIVRDSVDKITKNEFNKRRMKYGVYCYDEPWGIQSPYRNFSGEIPPQEKKLKLTADAFLKHKIGKKTCGSCPIGCWSIYRYKYEEEWVTTEALQANDIHNFGAKLDMNEPEDVLFAHHLCNELGLDVDAVSNVIGWAFQCYNAGVIDKGDTGGLELEWGNKQAVFQLMKQIAQRDGFGDVLADGCREASRKIGRGSEFCVHVKGNDLFECLWMSRSWALGVVVSPRGGTHTRGCLIEERMRDLPGEVSKELFGIRSIGPITDYENKEKLVVFMERLNAVLDCLGICMFTHSSRPDMLLPNDYANLLSAATGLNMDWKRLLCIGERIHTLEKSLNVIHTNWTRKDDLPPKRFIETPLAGKYYIDMKKWNKLLDRYYELHGWSTQTSWPKKETLMKLGLGEVYERIRNKRAIH